MLDNGILREFGQRLHHELGMLKQVHEFPEGVDEVESVAETLVGNYADGQHLANHNLAIPYDWFLGFLSHGEEHSGVTEIINVVVNRRAFDGLKVGNERGAVERQKVEYGFGQKSVHVGELQQTDQAADQKIRNNGEKTGHGIGVVLRLHRNVLLYGFVYPCLDFREGFVSGEIEFYSGVGSVGTQISFDKERYLYAVAGIDAAVADESVYTGIQC